MGFGVFMLIMCLLIPIVMIGFWGCFRKTVPKKINWVFGYRTKRSMVNSETWEFAHHHMGNLWYRWGIVILPISVIVMLPFCKSGIDIVGIVGTIIICVQIIPLIVCVAVTEKALKEAFDDYGRRRF